MEVKVSAASHQHDLSLRMLTLVAWLWSCLSGFFTAKVTLPPAVHSVLCPRKSLRSPPSKGGTCSLLP